MPRERRPVRGAGSGGGRPLHTSAPLPLERSILWTPRGVEGPGTGASFPEGAYPLFLEHDLLAGVNRHLDRVEREPRFGFLLGRLYHCPELDIDYAVADTAVAAREILSEEASGAYIIRAWSEAQAVFSGHSGLLLGWYHSHYRFGLMPTEADRDTIARYFDAPWQLSIIVVPDRARPLGAVFRTLPVDIGDQRDRPAAFYELSPMPHGGDIGRAHSAVTWANYQAHPPAQPVFGEAEEAPPAAATAPPAAGTDLPAPPAEAAEEPEESEPGPVAEPRQVVAPEEPAAAEEVAAAAEVAAAPEVDAADVVAAAGEAERATEPLAPAERAGGRAPGEFPAPPDRPMPQGDWSLRGVPLVMPGEKAEMGLLPPRSRRISWPVVATGVALLAAAVFFVFRDTPSTSTGRTAPEPSSTRGEAATSAEIRQFFEEANALEIAGERYAERGADFDAGRIGCDLLTTGYVAADEAYVRVAAAYGNPAVRANSRAAAAYEEAGAEIAEINSHFDGSGCPRP